MALASGTSPAANGAAARETSVPAEREQWPLHNPEALAAVKRGLADSAAGRGVKVRFLEFVEIDLDD